MVLLDVVYNHFGPEGNYLHLYAPDFFHPERQTPWGAAIAYEKPPVRALLHRERALLAGGVPLRRAAPRRHRPDRATRSSDEPILEEIAAGGPRARFPDRHVHLTTEDDRNITRLHERGAGRRVRALHRRMERRLPPRRARRSRPARRGLLRRLSPTTGCEQLARALAEGFVYQGEPSPYRDGAPRGEPSAPPAADRLRRLPAEPRPDRQPRLRRAARPRSPTRHRRGADRDPAARRRTSRCSSWARNGARRGPSPSSPISTASSRDAVREGRRREFAKLAAFADAAQPRAHPRPERPGDLRGLASSTGASSTTAARARLARASCSGLLAIRRREIVPRLAAPAATAGQRARRRRRASIAGRLARSTAPCSGLCANLSTTPRPPGAARRPGGRSMPHGGAAPRRAAAALRPVLRAAARGASLTALDRLAAALRHRARLSRARPARRIASADERCAALLDGHGRRRRRRPRRSPRASPPPPTAPSRQLRAPEGVACFMPDWLEEGRAWGVACQLYRLRSARNWGIGDFADLAALRRARRAPRAPISSASTRCTRCSWPRRSAAAPSRPPTAGS